MKKDVIHIINSKKENAILIVHGSHELRRYPRDNFMKNPDLIYIFCDDLKEMYNNGIVLIFD